ncbi:alpha/beta hydrolase [Nocardiopsis gilva YIM 90087]|uniref:Alpha/beta hydrolase n=1 Tax=Nocardiopsis gilva YIM 90087 TaxID=1235441 RepID=A0A223SCG6_9ACTN|nr:alpha/beta hydrolase [Nocardiopsis gilva]ASU85776.1 alpha/beta hydrolase [Nocardiopsis gilva YIM 90087]
MIRSGWVGGALALVLVATGCTPTTPAVDGDEGGDSDRLAAFYQQDIDWRECGEGFECGGYEVPLDYDDPGGERLEIAVKRLPASGSDVLGSLVVNPGGPGGSGYEYVDAATGAVSRQVRERFDVVGFDPRGVGRSAPLTCLDSGELDEFIAMDYDSEGDGADPADVSAAGLKELEAENRAFVEGCREQSGDLMLHVGTANVARDMDVLRAVLGDEGLTFLGKSYGTYIGTQYADLFPERVRALVLDGAIDPAMDQLELSVQQAQGFETALRAFVADCLDTTECPLGDEDASVEDGVGKLVGLMEKAGEKPLRNTTGDGREVNRTRAELGVMAALYSESFWPRVRSALADAFEGDGTALLMLGDDLYERADEDSYENSAAALVAVNCSDHPSPRDIGAYEEAVDQAAEEAPVFGPSLTWGALTCAYWPEEAVAEPEPMDAPGAAPILVIGTTRDSATPYEWAERLAKGLESGVLLTREGDGHTGYRKGSLCVDDAVDAYLLEGTPPDDGTVCTE